MVASRPVLVVTPYSLESNPYLPSLVAAMRAAGARVELAQGSSPILLLRALRRHGVPRVVHLQWHHRYLTADRLPAAVARATLFLAQWLLLRALGARSVWTVHNIVEHERRQARWERFACRRLARRVDALVAHCPQAAALVAAAYGVPAGRLRVVPLGLPDVVGEPEREAARRQLGIGDDEVFLLSFGRVRPYKGLRRLLATFRAIDATGLRLAVAGYPDDPAYAADLERLAADDPRVELRLGTVDDAELSRLLVACDAAVLPYRDSLTSGAAIHAAAHGRAVIAPRLGCLQDLPDDAALLYDPDADDGLARALELAATAPLPALGEAAREYARKWPWPEVARATIGVYDQVAGR